MRRLTRGCSRAGLALCLLLAACASSLGADIPGDTTTVRVPAPGPGQATVALLRFYLAPGSIPDLRITNGYQQPASAAFVGGIAPVGNDNTRFVGLVAIVNFKGPSGARPGRGSAGVAANQPFFVDYLGDLAQVGGKGAAIQAILSGIPGPEAWTVDWFNQPPVTTQAAQQYTLDGRSLLDATFRRLLNRPDPGFLAAIAGPLPSSPAGGATLAQAGPTGAAALRVSGATPPAGATPAVATPPGGGSPGTGSPSTGPPALQASPSPSPAPKPSPVPLSTLAVPVSLPGPFQPGTQVVATPVCPTGTSLVGGGFDLHTSAYTNPNNSLRAMGAFPSATDGSPVGSGPATAYAAVGGAGGQAMTDAVTSALAICARGWQGAVAVINTTVPGPSQAATTQAVTASCPGGTTLIGGGGQVTIRPPSNEPSLHLVGDYPSDAGGNSPASGTSVHSWTAVAAAGGTDIVNAQTSAFALCAHGGPPTEVIRSTVAGPEAASLPMAATATCPAGTVLLGGGVRADLQGGTPQQGVHLTGSYPGSEPVPAATVAAGASWTGVGHSGGQATPGTETSAFALCAQP